MVRQTLLRLHDDVSRWLLAGTAALPTESVSAYLATFRALAARVPALAALASGLQALAESERARRAPALLDLLLRAQQARDALATVGTDGPLTNLPDSGPWETPLPAGETADTHDALAWKLKGNWRRIERAAQNGRCTDLRLLGPALTLLDHAMWAVARMVADKVLPAFGAPLAAELRRDLDVRGKAGQRRRLKLLCTLDPDVEAEVCEIALREGNGPMIAQALECLTPRLSRPQAVALLLDFIGHRTKAARETAEKLLAGYGPEGVPGLIERVRSGPARVRISAIRTVGRLGRDAAPAVPALAEALAVPELAVPAARALSLLGHLGAPAVPALAEALRSPPVRTEALRALTAIGRAARAVGPALCALLSDAKPGEASWELLGALQPVGADVRAVVPILATHWEGGAWHNLHGVPAVLRAAGPDAAAAVPVLLRSLVSSDLAERKAAVSVLKVIGPNLRPSLPQLAELARQALSDTPPGPALPHALAQVLASVSPYADLPEFLPVLLEVVRNYEVDSLRAALEVLTEQASSLPLAPHLQTLVPGLCAMNQQPFHFAEAARKLVARLDPAGRIAVSELVPGIDNSSAPIRERTLAALRLLVPTCPEARELLPRFLHDATDWTRVLAVRALGELGLAAAGSVPELHRLLREDPFGQVRQSAAEALYRITSDAQACLAVLVPLLEGTTDRVNAAGGLKRLGPAAAPALPHLWRLARDGTYSEQRKAAVEAIGHIAGADSETLAVLAAALADEEVGVRLEAANALGQLGVATPEVVAALREALKRDPKHPFMSAARALGRLRPPPVEAVPDLLPLLERNYWYDYTQGGLALLRLGQATREALRALSAGPRAKPTLKERVRDRNPIYMFPELAGEPPLPPLVEALDDTQEAFRCVAALNLIRRPEFTERAVEVLAAAVQSDPDDDLLYLRVESAQALGERGAAAAPAIPALRAALETVGSWELRGELWRSLARIERAVEVRHAQ